MDDTKVSPSHGSEDKNERVLSVSAARMTRHRCRLVDDQVTVIVVDDGDPGRNYWRLMSMDQMDDLIPLIPDMGLAGEPLQMMRSWRNSVDQ
jgi:hypothetical protein